MMEFAGVVGIVECIELVVIEEFVAGIGIVGALRTSKLVLL